MGHELWYRHSARHWEEALPLGNGRLGAMVFGGGARERMALNEETLWSGYPKDTNRPGAAERWARARDLALSGKLPEAQDHVERELLGGFTQSYLPLGDLLLSHPGNGEARELTRRLSLQRAVHETRYSLGGVRYVRMAFVSHPAQALFVRLGADRPGAVDLDISLQTQLRGEIMASGARVTADMLAPSDVVPSYIACDDPVTYSDAPEERGMRARAVAVVSAPGGTIKADGAALRVRGADAVEIRLVARTSFGGYDRQPFTDGKDEKRLCEADLAAISGLGWDAALAAHIADHRALYDRAEIDLGGAYNDLPTDERLLARREDDTGLAALLFHFGRYLLIASSRPGGEPANLQGIWSQDLRAIWSCNYTININTEMNYWLAEAANLPELCEPLLRMIEELADHGQRTARVHYGARGAVAHHNTDLWRLTNPVGEQHKGFAGCAFWPMSLGWLLRQFAEHDRYAPDDALARRALPLYRLAARFYLDAAVLDKDGWLTIAPATSPENTFTLDGRNCRVSARTEMTTRIMDEVFHTYLKLLDRLRIDEPMAAEARAAIEKLAPPQIGAKGQILEWEREYPEPEPEHRHISHLYGLYPADCLDDAARDAARRSLELRGDEGTGWSLAWKTAAWARLGDGERAWRLLRRQLQPVEAGTACNLNHGGSYISLLDAHPPFQIDGNFGAAAAIAEMLVQTHGGRIALLPALPAAWKRGSAHGLRAPGNVELDFAFAEGRITRLHIKRRPGTGTTLQCNGQIIEISADDPRAEIELI